MKDRDIFENLIIPIKNEITEEQYKFILSRFDIFIRQSDVKSNVDGEKVHRNLDKGITVEKIYFGK